MRSGCGSGERVADVLRSAGRVLGAGLGQIEVLIVPVVWKMTRRPISTAWSAKRS